MQTGSEVIHAEYKTSANDGTKIWLGNGAFEGGRNMGLCSGRKSSSTDNLILTGELTVDWKRTLERAAMVQYQKLGFGTVGFLENVGLTACLHRVQKR